MDRTYTWPDGKKYVGEWENDEFHGQGTFIFPENANVTELKDVETTDKVWQQCHLEHMLENLKMETEKEL